MSNDGCRGCGGQVALASCPFCYEEYCNNCYVVHAELCESENARESKRDRRLRNEINVFARKYRRGKSPGHDPNDRTYDREVEALVKRMTPEELDHYLNGPDDV